MVMVMAMAIAMVMVMATVMVMVMVVVVDSCTCANTFFLRDDDGHDGAPSRTRILLMVSAILSIVFGESSSTIKYTTTILVSTSDTLDFIPEVPVPMQWCRRRW